jgi:hypothetical protein
MAEDLKYFVSNSIFEYKFKDANDKKIIERYFNVEYIGTNKIYYSINIKIMRKIKLFKINQDVIYEIIQKIIDNSTTADIGELFTCKLSEEMAKEIDKEILKDLQNYIDSCSK